MLPIVQAKQIFEQKLGALPERARLLAGTFEDALTSYRRSGYVISNRDCFVMVRAVKLDDGRVAWMPRAAVGSLKAIIRSMPFPLPYIAFYRREETRLRVYRTERLLNLIRVIL